MRKKLRELAGSESVIDDGLSRRRFVVGVAAAGAAAGIGGVVSAQDEGMTEVDLGGKIQGWVGNAPESISGETNPTLTFPAGETVTITWENLDGAPHNVVIQDGSGNNIVRSELVSGQGSTQTVEFTASEEMAEYYCEAHPSLMRGTVEIVSGGGGTETPTDTPTDTPEDTPTDTPEDTPTDTPEDTPTDTPEPDPATAEVTFDDQDTLGESVTVQSVTMSEGGFVTIHDGGGAVIGVSDYLGSGSHGNVEVDLFDVEGGDFDRSSLQESGTLVAMPHLDTDGDETYDFLTSGGEEDGPYTDDQGNAVTDDASITVC